MEPSNWWWCEEEMVEDMDETMWMEQVGEVTAEDVDGAGT